MYSRIPGTALHKAQGRLHFSAYHSPWRPISPLHRLVAGAIMPEAVLADCELPQVVGMMQEAVQW